MDVVLQGRFVKAVEYHLVRLDWTRTKLAEEMGVSKAMISQYLNGEISPGVDVVERFAKALRLKDPAQLFEDLPAVASDKPKRGRPRKNLQEVA